ncbi:hypothetical protein AMATHDRAFT_49809 [Amanita thiersii Skay4041]|uniref:Uncharacterized protein n=1 Tax=Amanita thiersii Skay4041 TaxID=703135 RepID=A0A2A9NII2_9AGAR|nr:hypothetical protein AMATHDRAFT_49809 [Amanita thiersii Skay4041]
MFDDYYIDYDEIVKANAKKREHFLSSQVFNDIGFKYENLIALLNGIGAVPRERFPDPHHNTSRTVDPEMEAARTTDPPTSAEQRISKRRLEGKDTKWFLDILNTSLELPEWEVYGECVENELYADVIIKPDERGVGNGRSSFKENARGRVG